jgi:energy-coupling factor transporter ATP-binding protein EcfA2
VTDEQDEQPTRLPNYDLGLYQANPLLGVIRDHAHSRITSADAVLLSALTIVSASIPGGITIDSGIASKITPGLFTAICGPSGTGKTSAERVARGLVQGPAPLTLTTGEGLLESFYGETEVQEVDAKGNQITRKMRARMRTNNLFIVGEGSNFYADLNRENSKLGGILRDFWSGTDIGTTTASAERARKLESGSYNGGLIVGLQTGIVGQLITDTVTGTAQRFLWAAATDPTVDPDAHHYIGALFDPPHIPLTVEGKPIVDDLVITVVDDIYHEIRNQRIRILRGEEQVPEHDSQQPVMQLKVGATLAWLDGRLRINHDDWELAKALVAESNKVRDALIEAAEEAQRAEVTREGNRLAAVKAAVESRPERLRQVRARIAQLLSQSTEPVPHGKLRAGISRRGNARDLFPEAIDQLLSMQPPVIERHETERGAKYSLSLYGRNKLAEAA